MWNLCTYMICMNLPILIKPQWPNYFQPGSPDFHEAGSQQDGWPEAADHGKVAGLGSKKWIQNGICLMTNKATVHSNYRIVCRDQSMWLTSPLETDGDDCNRNGFMLQALDPTHIPGCHMHACTHAGKGPPECQREEDSNQRKVKGQSRPWHCGTGTGIPD